MRSASQALFRLSTESINELFEARFDPLQSGLLPMFEATSAAAMLCASPGALKRARGCEKYGQPVVVVLCAPAKSRRAGQ